MLLKFATLAIATLSLASNAPVYAASVENYGDPAIAAVAQRAQQSFNVLQIGDSHTAGDLLTGQLRKQLQERLGNGGVGWINPMPVAGQQQTQVKYQQSGWQLSSSRTSSDQYAMGGLLATPNQAGATLRVSPTQPTQQLWQVTATIRQGSQDQPLEVTDADGKIYSLAAPVRNHQWQHVNLTLRPPFVVTAGQSSETALGGWFIRAAQGATVGAMGINGSQLTHWQRWRDQWSADLTHYDADLVILSYGTNEAFNGNLDVQNFSHYLAQTVQTIRRNSPKTAVLIVGAPESLRAKTGTCGVRSLQLDAVQAAQKRVAQQQRTLFWDWQDSMGGRCSMMSWIGQGIAARDGVHFSASGYRRSGDDLYEGLMQVMNNPATSEATPDVMPLVPADPATREPQDARASAHPVIAPTLNSQITCHSTADGSVMITNRASSERQSTGKAQGCQSLHVPSQTELTADTKPVQRLDAVEELISTLPNPSSP